MKVLQILLFSVLALLTIALVGLAGGLMVLLAYGVGLLVNLVMHMEPFHATLLSLVGITISGWFAVNLLNNFIFPPTEESAPDDEDDFDDEYDDEEDETEEEDIADRYPGIPLWRQPRKNPDFSNAQPDDRCPCGSGRKYKNCHGGGKKPSQK